MSIRTFPIAMVSMLAALATAALQDAALATETPVAMVTDFSGDGEILHGRDAGKLRLFAELEPDSKVRVKKGSRAVVLYLQSGDQYALPGPGDFTIGADQPRPEKKSAKPTKLAPVTGKDGKVMQIRHTGLSQAGMVMRSAGKRPIAAKRPLAALVLSTPSLFEWEAIGGVTEYEFLLKDEKENTLLYRTLPDNKLSLPADLVLDAGVSYRWSVSARGKDGGRYLSVYRLRMADADMKSEVDNYHPPETATLADQVAFAAWLESSGLSDEAARYWGELSKRYGLAESRN